MKKVICFHLYNDYSGSPRVLSLVIRALVEKGYQVELYTSNTDGFLTGLEGVVNHLFRYNNSVMVVICSNIYVFLLIEIYP